MTEPVPRRAGVDDAEAIAGVWLRARKASIPAIPPPVHTDDEVRSYFASVVLPAMETWVIDRGDPPAVAALLVLHHDWIEHLYVEPEAASNGLGSALVEKAKAERPERLRLWTFAANGGARRFYERHGFVAIDCTDGDNEEGAPDVLYEWTAATPPAG